jgi:hypothetical protein
MISVMSNTPPKTAPMAALALVDRPDKGFVFASGLADVVEDGIVDADVVDENVTALLDEVEETPINYQ